MIGILMDIWKGLVQVPLQKIEGSIQSGRYYLYITLHKGHQVTSRLLYQYHGPCRESYRPKAYIRTWVSLSKSHDGLELGYIRKAQYLRQVGLIGCNIVSEGQALEYTLKVMSSAMNVRLGSWFMVSVLNSIEQSSCMMIMLITLF